MSALGTKNARLHQSVVWLIGTITFMLIVKYYSTLSIFLSSVGVSAFSLDWVS